MKFYGISKNTVYKQKYKKFEKYYYVNYFRKFFGGKKALDEKEIVLGEINKFFFERQKKRLSLTDRRYTT